ncbi:MAG: hypothetical protein Q9162_002635 [Coniocarpon cinnabarinum]
MATIKAIEGRSIHQIQSGQVIVDLTSVVKELVENSLDAGANAIDVRFKAQGLEAIEVQDNGSGIARADYETLGLKHYTSKLSDYDDLSSLQTFGFRGEALSSLCALSNLHIITAQDGEAPKGTRLDFEQSGKLRSSSVAATQKGSLVVVEDLFQSLPVRRRELEKNIKREYSKVITQLNAYACVSTNVRFSVSQQAAKGKKVYVFSTRNNLTTKENIANVYGTKAVSALIPLSLSLEMQPTAPSQVLRDIQNEDTMSSRQIKVEGHISKPVHGEGRQTPDRQMFFVNSRPCGLPQVAKAFNEVYRSYNMNQSPFIFANFRMDTNAYDVNVSPDKKTIMLHDQQRLLETLKDALVDLFENQDQTIPTQQIQTSKLPSFKPPSVIRQSPSVSNQSDRFTNGTNEKNEQTVSMPIDEEQGTGQRRSGPSPESTATTTTSLWSSMATGTDFRPAKLIGDFAGRHTGQRHEESRKAAENRDGLSKDKQKLARKFERQSLVTSKSSSEHSHPQEALEAGSSDSSSESEVVSHTKAREEAEVASRVSTDSVKPMQEAPTTPARESVTGVMKVGATASKLGPLKRRRPSTPEDEPMNGKPPQSSYLSSSLRTFVAPGARLDGPVVKSNALTSFLARGSTERKDRPGTCSEGSTDNDAESEEHEAQVQNKLYSDDGSPRRDAQDSSNQGAGAAGLEEDLDHKTAEEARVRRMVQDAEATTKSARSSQKRLRLQRRNDETLHNVVKSLSVSTSDIQRQHDITHLPRGLDFERLQHDQEDRNTSSQVSAEEQLSLSIAKSDFAHMRIVGQFNLGFILAVRPVSSLKSSGQQAAHGSGELFIIDQHASDEIYNFHRLSATTTLTPQPLVRPHPLQLTAIEEETILDHRDASLAKNGFNIDVDTSGDKPVGERCALLTLPTSKETVFNVRDLEELLVLLAEAPVPSHLSPPLPDVDTSEHLEGVSSHRTLPLQNGVSIVRPTKVRKMLAMRACRSSIMVGKALTQTGMQRVVTHMGEIERPWNCPHGRPTMRHLSRLDKAGGWDEWATTWKGAGREDMNEGEEGINGVWLPGSSQLDGGRPVTDEASLWKDWLASNMNAIDDGGSEENDDVSEDATDDDEEEA